MNRNDSARRRQSYNLPIEYYMLFENKLIITKKTTKERFHTQNCIWEWNGQE